MTLPSEAIETGWVEVSADDPAASQIVDGKWYAPKFGCDSLEMTIEAIRIHDKAVFLKIVGEDETQENEPYRIDEYRQQRNDLRAELRLALKKMEGTT
jgi:hypothetical protein